MTDFHDNDASEDRPRRKKQDRAEHGLSHWVDVFMDRCFVGPCWYTAIEGGTYLKGASKEARMTVENRRRARGIKPAHLDWYAWQASTGLYTQFELKVDGRRTRRGQDQTIAMLRRNNIPTGVYETVPDVCRHMTDAGFVLHRNAVNIAAQLHEEYLAARRTAAAPKKTRAPRSVAPGKAAAKRFAAKWYGVGR